MEGGTGGGIVGGRDRGGDSWREGRGGGGIVGGRDGEGGGGEEEERGREGGRRN